MKDLERYLALATGLMILASAFVIASEGPALALTNVNVSQQPDNQTEAAIAINPTNPDNIVVVSNASAGGSLFRSVSMDGGITWARSFIANGDALGTACCDPSLAFDTFGNLFLAFLDFNGIEIQLGLSTDGGNTFTFLSSFGSEFFGVDQPTVATGPGNAPGVGSVWVMYRVLQYSVKLPGGGIDATGAPVTGLGTVGAFLPRQGIPGSRTGNFGDIAIGPAGQVMVTYQDGTDDGRCLRASNIYVSLKPDGLGPNPFNADVLVTSTNVCGFYPIPAQSNRTIDAEAGLAWDRSGGANNGRVYLVYTDATSFRSSDTNIFVRLSNNNGSTWSAPVRVNDDTGTRSQFLPRIALDQTTGYIGVSWHDSRNDVGFFGDADLFGTKSTDGGGTFLPNVQVSQRPSNAVGSGSSLDFGDYTGLAFHDSRFFPAWADNSNSTGDNPDGTLSRFDIYTAKSRFAYVKPSASNTVSVINTASNSVVATIPVDQTGGHVAFTPNGASAYVTAPGNLPIVMIDAASNTQCCTVPTPANVDTEALAVTPDGRRAYVAGFESNRMSVLVVDTDPSSLTFNSVVATVSNPFGPDIGAFALAITPDGRRAYAPGNDFVNNKIWVIDTDPSSSTFNSVVLVMNVGGPGVPLPRGVAITPDGRRAYVAFGANSDTGNFVRVIDTATNSVVADIAVSRNPVWVTITPNGRLAYVSHQQGPNGSIITRIDTLSNTVVGTIPINVPTGNLQALAMTPDGTHAYVTNGGDPGRFIPGSIQVINIPSNSVVATIPVDTGAGVAIRP